MTVASSATAELSLKRIALHAYRLASLWGIDQQPVGVQWERYATHGLEALETIVKGLEAEGRLVRARRFYELTLVADQASYDLPEDIMDVYGDAMYILPGETTDTATAETVVRQIDQDTWQRLGTRASTGRPTTYYAYRGSGSVQVRLWLKPDSDNLGTIRFQVYYLLANSTSGDSTPDLERHWAEYLIHALAAKVAEAGNLDGTKIGRLMGESSRLLDRAKRYSRQRTNNQAMVMHRVGSHRYR
jgi:hypothetical protein